MSKKIEINPKLFSVKNTTIKNRGSKKNFKKKNNQTITGLRKKILDELNKKSKSEKENKQQKSQQPPPILKKNNDDFENTMNFLEKKFNTKPKQETSIENSSVSKEPIGIKVTNVESNVNKSSLPQQTQPQTQAQTQPQTQPQTQAISPKNIPITENVNLELPESLQEINLSKNISSIPLSNIVLDNSQVKSNKTTTRKNLSEPVYGCLKNGIKPTMKKNTTVKNSIVFDDKLNYYEGEDSFQEQTTPTIMSEKKEPINVIEETPELKLDPISEITNDDISNDNKKLKKNKMALKLNKTKKILGKDEKKRKVSLIINNNTVRKTIKKEKHVLNTTPIKKIRHYLKRKGLIEAGSTAPDDVLRSIYTNSKLSGDIENKNGETYINNYMNTHEG
tara:strand:+ start:835 stop:2010 length:1176 start_codon:yes stop_codon:yes gene_type:complete